jgi:hypothetical protein
VDFRFTMDGLLCEGLQHKRRNGEVGTGGEGREVNGVARPVHVEAEMHIRPRLKLRDLS